MTLQQAGKHEYRPDIDGLRAVAVGSVVVFHAFPEALAGGFVGVDIFFVISGFLISKIIFEQLERGTFTFSDFYSRRIKRIFPALVLVLIACLIFGNFALLDDEFRELGKHVAGGAGFISNLMLWSEAGYFDASADTKPLLHLWSLGIEEQFYIFWPLVLWAIWRRKLSVWMVLVAVAAVSCYLNLRAVGTNPVAAFYSPLTRVWELLCGSMLAWWTLHRGNSALSATAERSDAWPVASTIAQPRKAPSAVAIDVLALTGLVLLAWGLRRIDRTVEFPGVWAFLPVGGAVALIAAGPTAWVNRVVLSNRLAVWIGLISFPLYLWHWPLLSFARIVESGEPNVGIRIAAVALAIVLAWLTFRLLERPFRSNDHRNVKVLALAILMASTGVVGYAIHRDKPVVDAVTWKSLSDWKVNCDGLFPDWTSITDNPCRMQKKAGNDVALIGDSHAGHLLVGLAESSSATGGVALFPASCAAPFIDVASGRKVVSAREIRENAYQLINRAYEYILKDDSISTVVLAHQPLCSYEDAVDMADPTHDDYRKAWAAGMRRTFSALSAAGKRIVVVLDNPFLPYDPKLCVARPFRISATDDRCTFPREQFFKMPAYAEYAALVRTIAKDYPRVQIVDLADLFCDAKVCRISIGGKLMYSDRNHLSWDGSRYVAPFLKKAINPN